MPSDSDQDRRDIRIDVDQSVGSAPESKIVGVEATIHHAENIFTRRGCYARTQTMHIALVLALAGVACGVSGLAVAAVLNWSTAMQVAEPTPVSWIPIGGFAGADLAGQDLAGADLSQKDLSAARLTGADLSGANLRNTDLTSADLTGADLAGADLTDARLTGANLRGANLNGANLLRADLANAVHDERTVWPAGFRPPVSARDFPSIPTPTLP